MFLKNFACYILFSYQCSSMSECILHFELGCRSCVSLINLTYLTELVNSFFNFFQNLFYPQTRLRVRERRQIEMRAFQLASCFRADFKAEKEGFEPSRRY